MPDSPIQNVHRVASDTASPLPCIPHRESGTSYQSRAARVLEPVHQRARCSMCCCSVRCCVQQHRATRNLEALSRAGTIHAVERRRGVGRPCGGVAGWLGRGGTGELDGCGVLSHDTALHVTAHSTQYGVLESVSASTMLLFFVAADTTRGFCSTEGFQSSMAA